MSAHNMSRSMIFPVMIGKRRIGPGLPVFVVAEAGVNHNGRLETALALVDAAVDAGADAVKFQMFQAARLVAASAPTAKYQQDRCGETSQRAMLSELELSDSEFARIRRHCDTRAIVFLATPFSEDDVVRLLELDVQAIKIASTDLTNDRLLTAAAATALPLILSTGASTAAEINAAVVQLRGLDVDGRMILLHCVSCYPTPVEAMNLRAILSLERAFAVPCGLSDHSLGAETGGWAVAAGACVVEKHFTLDQTAAGPDHAMSLDPKQLADYVATIRAAERAMGDGNVGMQQLESEVRRVALKSVVSATTITAGTRITEGMLTLKRPGTGIPAGELAHLVDRQAIVDIPPDVVLSWDMFR